MLRRVAVAILLLSVVPGQDSSAGLEPLRFVGRGQRSALLDSLDDDGRLLLAFRHGATLDGILAAGVSFRSERIRRLLDLGLLDQQGRTFRTRFPVMTDDESAGFRQALRRRVPGLVREVLPSFRALREALEDQGLSRSFPALATWALRERGWHHRLEGIDLPELVAAQLESDPDRGWWGVVWYVEPALAPLQRLDVARNRDWTLQLCWAPGTLPAELGEGAIVRGRLGRLLARLDDDGRRVDDADGFPGWRQAGLLDADGRLRVEPLTWDPDDEGTIAAAVEAAASAVAVAVEREASPAAVGLEGFDEVAAASMIYHELVPELLRGLDAVGLAVVVGTSALDGAVVGADAEGTAVSHSPDTGRPLLSAVLWNRLPAREPAFPLPW